MNETAQVILRLRQQTTAVAGPAGDEQYHIAVIQAPGRGWGGPVAGGELHTGEIKMLRRLYREFLLRYRQSMSEQELHPLRVVGNNLFLALPESVQMRLGDAVSWARAHGRKLSLALQFTPAATALLALPWELLHHPDGNFFFALQGGGMTRELVLPFAPLQEAPWPQAVLGLWSEPTGVDPLTERRQHGLAPERGSGIQWRQGTDSMGQLQHALATGEFDGLHVVAHGRAGEAWGGFALALTDEKGDVAWTTTDQLVTLLGDYPQVRFVYLDVCSSGDAEQHGADEDADLHPGGVAQRLLGIGVETAVVMQDVMGQAAAGVMADTFYQTLHREETVETAVATGRRAVRLQQDDVIHWSVPALYRPVRTPQPSSPLADWILDRVTISSRLLFLFPGLVLLLIGLRLSYLLAQVQLHDPTHWPRLAALLLATNLIALPAAAMTRPGQEALQRKFGLNSRAWLPFLIHKYFGAVLWPLLAWLPGWAVWLGVYAAGWGETLPTAMRQSLWAVILAGIGVAAHTGARQAIRQSLLFLRVGTVIFANQLLNYGLILFSMLFVPFLGPLLWGTVRLMYATLFPAGAFPFDLFFGVIVVGMALLLYFLADEGNRKD